jgi:septal ring-binding cell division protein DamX
VAGYTITITPTDDETGAQTTIRVDTADGGARITELTVRAVEGNGLSAGQLPALNLDQLIAALAPPTQTAITATPSPAEEAPAAAETPQPAASEVAQESPVSPRVGRSARGKKAGRKAAKKAPARTRQSGAEKTAAAAQPSTGRRAYRRMPEPGEVVDAYRQVGGTTALARHFGVPRHTATGWLRRLRSQGLIES